MYRKRTEEGSVFLIFRSWQKDTVPVYYQLFKRQKNSRELPLIDQEQVSSRTLENLNSW